MFFAYIIARVYSLTKDKTYLKLRQISTAFPLARSEFKIIFSVFVDTNLDPAYNEDAGVSQP
jgi:hypothetical protein